MDFLVRMVPAVLMAMLLLQYTSSQPLLGRTIEDDEKALTRIDCSRSDRCLFAQDHSDDLVTDRRSSRGSGLQTRQLGDIEFTNRYGEYLKSKAKLTSICSFLRRMQTGKKSGLGGDTEKVNALMKQYMCPNIYQ